MVTKAILRSEFGAISTVMSSLVCDAVNHRNLKRYMTSARLSCQMATTWKSLDAVTTYTMAGAPLAMSYDSLAK